jgi:hypothetical protein
MATVFVPVMMRRAEAQAAAEALVAILLAPDDVLRRLDLKLTDNLREAVDRFESLRLNPPELHVGQ